MIYKAVPCAGLVFVHGTIAKMDKKVMKKVSNNVNKKAGKRVIKKLCKHIEGCKCKDQDANTPEPVKPAPKTRQRKAKPLTLKKFEEYCFQDTEGKLEELFRKERYCAQYSGLLSGEGRLYRIL